MENELETYIKKKNIFDIILSMIVDSDIGKKYTYYDNEVSFSVDPNFHKIIDRKDFTTDVCFINEKDNAVLLIEETEAPSEKLDQLLAYCLVHERALQTILKSDSFPDIDIFVIIPFHERANAITLYKNIESHIAMKKKIGGRVGLTVWYYGKQQDKMTKISGKFKNENLKALDLSSTSIMNENRIPITKKAPTIEILRFLYASLISTELGDENLHLTKEKIKYFLGEFGITREKRWKDALNLGGEIGLLENVNLDNLYAEPRYAKDHQTSLRYGAAFLNNPIEYMLAQIDQTQATLFDFQEEEEESEEEY